MILSGMKTVCRWTLRLGLALACVLSCRAQDDVSGNDIQLVSAVYGSNDRFDDVTSRVKLLLDGLGFAPNSAELQSRLPQSDENTLFIIYNYGDKRHFFFRRTIGHRISSGLLKEEAKLDDAVASPAPLTPDPSGDLQIIFAAYGLRGNFLEVTDSVIKQLHDSPAITLPGTKAFGVDPAPGGWKYTVIIYDVDGTRHVYTTKDNGPPITAGLLGTAAKAQTSH